MRIHSDDLQNIQRTHDQFLSSELESMSINVHPTNEGGFTLFFTRKDYWTGRDIQVSDPVVCEFEHLASTIYGVLMSWAPTQAARCAESRSKPL